MNTRRSRPALRVSIALVIGAGALAALRPWTVVPIEKAGARTFDADEYVASVWDARVLPAALSSAVDLRSFMENPPSAEPGGPQRRAVFVKGTARIAEVDRSSRVGVARLQLPWVEDGQAAAIQVGPVLRGTALRDALEFIQFTDFVNQLEFAGVANALNARVIAEVIDPLQVDDLAGGEVTFVGAVPVPGPGGAPILEIVPVQLQPTVGQ